MKNRENDSRRAFRRASERDLELEIWLRERNAGRIRWKTGTGEEIPISEMTGEHLRNALRMVRKVNEINEIILENLENGDSVG